MSKKEKVIIMATIKKIQKNHQDEDGLKISFMMTYPFTDTSTSSLQNTTFSKNVPLEQAWRDLDSEDEIFEFSKRLIDERLGLAMKILAEQSS